MAKKAPAKAPVGRRGKFTWKKGDVVVSKKLPKGSKPITPPKPAPK